MNQASPNQLLRQNTRRASRVIAAGDRFRPSSFVENLTPIDAPEAPLVVQFIGLSPQQQQAALAAFPGGKRFVLAS